MKLGARIIKTGVAIALSIYLAVFFHLQPPVYAAISATFAIQPSIYRSYQTILDQAQGNIIGAVCAILFVLVLGNHPLVIALVVIVVIVVNLKLKLEKTISLSVVTAIVIMESHTGSFISFAIDRFLLIMLGVAAAFLVNLIFIPPKYETKLFYSISDQTDEIIKWIRIMMRHAPEHSVIKDEIGTFKENSIKIDQFYLLYKEDRTYFRKNQHKKGRKLVIYRQMIYTTRKAFELLKSLHRHENELYQMPDELQQFIQSQLDCLTNYHEQTLLKYTNKIRIDSELHKTEDFCENKHELMEVFMKHYHMPKNELWIQLFPVFALIIDYSDQIDHLNRLIESFKTYHTSENKVKLTNAE